MSSNNKKEDDGDFGNYPNEKYRKFFETFKEIDSIDVSQWKPPHLIGYFCKKYEEQYALKYKFKFNSPLPSKCFETFQIKKLACLLSSNPSILRDYIDWVYLNKVVKTKRRLTSISFITVEGVVNEYKLNVLLAGDHNQNIDRSTPLPDKYQQVFTDCQVNAYTYGDVAFLYQIDPMSGDIASALDGIEKLGFDREILVKII